MAQPPSPRASARGLGVVFGIALAAAGCGSPEKIAMRCEVNHSLAAGDTVDARIERLNDSWAVNFRMRVRLSDAEPPMEIHGLGRVTSQGRGEVSCEIVDPGAPPGAPRFDDALCLDEVESVIDLLQEAEDAARPGERVVQEVRLRVRRRRRARSRVTAHAAFQERAEVERDAQGRVIHVVRPTADGGREEVRVSYPGDVTGRCLPSAPEER